MLVDELRDILHAEKQLLKALPKMAKAARSTQLQTLFETHLAETETQVERLNECLQLLGAPARAKRRRPIEPSVNIRGLLEPQGAQPVSRFAPRCGCLAINVLRQQ